MTPGTPRTADLLAQADAFIRKRWMKDLDPYTRVSQAEDLIDALSARLAALEQEVENQKGYNAAYLDRELELKTENEKLREIVESYVLTTEETP
jgi:hypothetical protein